MTGGGHLPEFRHADGLAATAVLTPALTEFTGHPALLDGPAKAMMGTVTMPSSSREARQPVHYAWNVDPDSWPRSP